MKVDESEITHAREPAEVRAAEEEFFHRRWYQVSGSLMGTPLDGGVARESRARTELKFPVVVDDSTQMTDFHAGWLLGAHQALRWALGDGERVEDASADT